MSLTTTTELKAALASWANRTDLTSQLDDCITLFESDFNRNVRVSSMEASMVSTPLVSGAATLPTAFLAFKEVRFGGDTNYTLQPKSLEWIRSQEASTGKAKYFAVSDTQIVCWPTTGPVIGTYYRSLPTLTGTSSNWLLASHPDIYLAGCLAELFMFTQDDQRTAMWRQRATSAVDALQRSDDKDLFDGGILAVRAR